MAMSIVINFPFIVRILKGRCRVTTATFTLYLEPYIFRPNQTDLTSCVTIYRRR